MSDTVTNESIVALAQGLDKDALIHWSDDKRKEFVGTFDARVRVAQYILARTADIVRNKAQEKHFISQKHVQDVEKAFSIGSLYDKDRSPATSYSVDYNRTSKVGGRDTDELDAIAQERADAILENLPPLNQAVRMISPTIAKMIEDRDALLAKGKKLLEESRELSGMLDMDDFDDKMTLSAFKAEVKNREKKRKHLIEQLDEIGDEGQKLTSKINKFLYQGLPGLSEAVIDVINNNLERATGFSSMNRRVSERVMFGDSETALEMLQTFEKDEVKVSSDVKAQFDAALDKLKLAGKTAVAGRKLNKGLKA